MIDAEEAGTPCPDACPAWDVRYERTDESYED